MKKIIYTIFSLAMVAMVSCSKDEIGGTNMQEMAGQWYVTMDGAYDDGSVWEDPYDYGPFLVFTFNTTQDSETEMWVSDEGNFWEFQGLVKVDKNSMTFGNSDWTENIAYDDCQMLITDGKIMKGAATTPSGMPADSIVFYVLFSDDDYAAAGYWDRMRFSGYRYTGFVADE
ncbi:MAG: hypothetical protein LIP09_13130 [Bacteroidales bacterium]|nr:hypothetical protein [Bacteroidales bacterium]